MNKNLKEIINVLPKNIASLIEERKDVNLLQEIRLRVNKPICIQIGNKEIVTSYVTNKDEIKFILQRISNYSIYAFQEEIKQGYITIKGGHRVGLSGNCVMENESIKTIKDISSINIRICREVIGCSKKVMPFILSGNNVLNTIIISPPKCGKTTILRDISRNLSNGYLNTPGKKIVIVDERSEIAACYMGVPQLDVGIRSDVYDNCIKSKGIMMAIRSLSPEIVICDEIGTDKDMYSIIQAMNSGVNVISTIHGFSVEDLFKRKVFSEVIDNKVFNRAIVLSNRKGISTIESVYDLDQNKNVWRENDGS